MTRNRCTPLARRAVISLSCDSRPNVISSATRTAQGTDSATTKPSDSTNSCSTARTGTPRLITRSRYSNSTSISKMNVTTPNPIRNGTRCCRRMYHGRILTAGAA